MAIFAGCEKDTIDKTTEVQQIKKISRINFSDFKSKISTKGLTQLENLFEGEQPNERTTSLSTPKVLMDGIIKVQFEDYATYTFKVITGTEANEFYNLVLYINDQKEVMKSHVLKYTPSDKWLADTTQYFSGNVAIMDNTFFDENAFTDILRGGDSCVTGVSTGWECYYGNEHAPGTCNGPIYEYTFVIEIETGTCSGGGGSTGGDFDPIGGGSGGTGDPGGDGDSLGGGDPNGDNNTINTSPNVIGDIDIFLEKARAVALVLGIQEGTLEYAYLTNYDNEEEVDEIAKVINNNPNSEAIAYVNKVVEAGKNNILVSVSPFVKYPENSNYSTLYPKLTEILKNDLPKIADNQKVIDLIHEITDAPKETIKEALQWGKGPTINIQQLGGEGDSEKYGSYRGHVFEEYKDILFLDIDLVNDYENAEVTEISDSFAFLIAVTILHEYIHLGDVVFGDNFWGELYLDSSFDPENEAGLIFERDMFGYEVWRSNAGLVLAKTGGF